MIWDRPLPLGATSKPENEQWQISSLCATITFIIAYKSTKLAVIFVNERTGENVNAIYFFGWTWSGMQEKQEKYDGKLVSFSFLYLHSMTARKPNQTARFTAKVDFPLKFKRVRVLDDENVCEINKIWNRV